MKTFEIRMKIIEFHISNTEGSVDEARWNFDVCLANSRSF